MLHDDSYDIAKNDQRCLIAADVWSLLQRFEYQSV